MLKKTKESVAEPIKLDVRGPVTIITYLGAATNEQYEAYLVELTSILTSSAARYARVGQVHDATAWTRSNAHQRQMQADWIKENMTVLRACGGFSAFVFKSALIRGGLTAVMWLVPMPGPYKICATLDEALDWMMPRVAPESVSQL